MRMLGFMPRAPLLEICLVLYFQRAFSCSQARKLAF